MGGDHVACIVAIVGADASVVVSQHDGGLHACGHSHGLVAVSGQIETLGKVDGLLFVQADEVFSIRKGILQGVGRFAGFLTSIHFLLGLCHRSGQSRTFCLIEDIGLAGTVVSVEFAPVEEEIAVYLLVVSGFFHYQADMAIAVAQGKGEDSGLPRFVAVGTGLGAEVFPAASGIGRVGGVDVKLHRSATVVPLSLRILEHHLLVRRTKIHLEVVPIASCIRFGPCGVEERGAVIVNQRCQGTFRRFHSV